MSRSSAVRADDDRPEPFYVDPRRGSKELYPELLKLRVPVHFQEFPFGDFVFAGRGPQGPEPIGVERKTLSDLATSLTKERLQGHQLPGLVEAFRFSFILVEGIYRVGKEGFIEVPRAREWVYLQPLLRGDGLAKWLLTLQLKGGVRVKETPGIAESAAWLAWLYGWWTDKAWDEHSGHLSLGTQIDPSLFQRPTLLRRMAAELPGIGYEKSAAVEQAFATIVDMVFAEESTWRQIPGIGKTLATRIVSALRTATVSASTRRP